MIIEGIDTSFAQRTINWTTVKSSGLVGWNYSRASYGANPADDDGWVFQRNHDECKRVGIPFGCYHFFKFSYGGAEQARHFLDQINGRYGQLIPMVDVEEDSGTTGDLQENIKQLDAFNQAVRAAVGCDRIVIYTNADTWNNTMGGTDAFSGQPLWVASPDRDIPYLPKGWTDWAIWQYGEKRIPGINGYVDVDRMKGPIASLSL